MNAIEAVNVPVPQPEVPPCELWVAANFTPAAGAWWGVGRTTERECDEEIRSLAPNIPVRKFYLTDSPPPVDQAAVAEAWRNFEAPLDTRTMDEDVAAFVAHLMESGVPRKAESNG